MVTPEQWRKLETIPGFNRPDASHQRDVRIIGLPLGSTSPRKSLDSRDFTTDGQLDLGSLTKIALVFATAEERGYTVQQFQSESETWVSAATVLQPIETES